MTGLSRRFASGGRLVSSAVVVFSIAWCAWKGEMQAATLANKNTTIGLDLTTPGGVAGMNSWVVDGVNQMAQQWFWYRVGAAGPESDLTALGAPVISQAFPQQLAVTYSSPQYSVRVSYLLAGGAAGSGNSGFTESVTLFNNTAAPVAFHFFEYTRLNLLSTVGGQSVTIPFDGTGFNNVRQTLGLTTFTANGTYPNEVEAAPFNQTLGKLTDANPTTLNGNPSAGPGDVTWAWEWDFTIGANDNKIISLNNNLVTVVPEPSALAFIAVGLGALLLRRRGEKAN